MKNKIELVFIVFLFSCLSSYSQKSKGGIPPSFSYTSKLKSASASSINIPVNIDVDKLKWEDQMAEKNGSPLRIAQSLPVEIDIRTTGEWTTLSSSVKIWRQSITATGALGIIIHYNDFFIPEGGKLFIYNGDQSQVLGAYTNETNPMGGNFATELIYGDSFTLEYVASETSSVEPRLAISQIGYMYNDNIILSPDKAPILTGSSCLININSVDGTNWQKQKRGVVLYFIYKDNGWFACTGSLINNTNNDGTPYLFTAAHCFSSSASYDTLIAYFNFEFSGDKNESVSPDYQTLVGVTPLVNIPLNKGSDNVLLKMKDQIPESYKPYFNGWDRREIAPQSGVIIHHPKFTTKKITTYVKPATSDQVSEGKDVGAKDGFWRVVYDGRSITEGGSSGSPLFNQDGLIVGTLTGGETFCNKLNYPDYYGKFWFGWDKYPNSGSYSDKSLKTYLDPSNKGVDVLSGYDPYNTSNIEESDIEQNKEFVLFPNPADNELNINTNTIIRNIAIYNMQGRLMLSLKNYNASTAVMQTSDLTPGVYTISIDTDAKKLSDKFIKK